VCKLALPRKDEHLCFDASKWHLAAARNRPALCGVQGGDDMRAGLLPGETHATIPCRQKTLGWNSSSTRLTKVAAHGLLNGMRQCPLCRAAPYFPSIPFTISCSPDDSIWLRMPPTPKPLPQFIISLMLLNFQTFTDILIVILAAFPSLTSCEKK